MHNQVDKIKILDCTLRDGGYINNWDFSNEVAESVISALVKSGMDIIECGFVSQTKGRENSTLFPNFEEVNSILERVDQKDAHTEFCVMINKGEYNLDDLPVVGPDAGGVTMIRYAFHKRDWQSAHDDIKLLIEKGYIIFVQPMVTLSYQDQEILDMLNAFNQLDIYAMYIVDSFGAMFGDDFRRLHYLFENNLKKGVLLGYHSHNNLQLAYSNAIDFVQIKDIDREIIIDSSIHGMGRGAGNLNTELFADYLNKRKNANYDILPILETVDNYVEAIYRENYWGYSIGHFLSASIGCHPNYATNLVNRKTLSITDMQQILSELGEVEKKNFSRDRIEELYLKHQSSKKTTLGAIGNTFTGKKVLILASGPSVNTQKDEIRQFINKEKPLVVSVNHIPEGFSPDYFFFSNQKRYNKFGEQIANRPLIITSNINIGEDAIEQVIAVDYHRLVYLTSNHNDNVTIMLINLLIEQKVDEIHMAGFDGYNLTNENYSYKESDRILERNELVAHNEQAINSLNEIRKKKPLHFLTESIFK